MASDVEDILAAVRSLPPQEQQEVLRRLTESLAATSSPMDLAANDFWSMRSVDELAQEQQVAPVTDIRALALPDWPDDESADDLIAYIYGQRHADRKV
jgi:hypothetical protein